MMNEYDVLADAEYTAGARDSMWEVWSEHRAPEAPDWWTLAGGATIQRVPRLQRSDVSAPLNLLEIKAQYRASHRTWWQRMPRLRWPW